MKIDRRNALALLTLPALPPMAWGAAPREGARPGPYMLGADVTWIAEDEAAGARFFVGGERKDPFAILKDAGFNYVRLRIFVDPARGYSAGDPANAWGGLRQIVKLGRRVKQAGMGLALSFHFSDTWADPEHQQPPAAWVGLEPARMAGEVQTHVRGTLRAMRAGGAPVDMAVIGNETTFGILWPQGRVKLSTSTGNPVTDANHRKAGPVGGFDGFAAFLKAGIAGAREAEPGVLIQLHNHLGRHWPIVREWTDALLARGVDFDVLGLSCYQQQAEGDWERTFREFTARYPGKGVLVAEYSSRKRYLNDLVHDLPGERGWGSFIWEPTRHQEAIFDKNGRDAGGGPRPNLLSQGLNSAEAPGGAAPVAAAAPPAAPTGPRKPGEGGDYIGNRQLAVYQRIAQDYGLSSATAR